MKKTYLSFICCLLALTATAHDRTTTQMQEIAAQQLNITSAHKVKAKNTTVERIINKPTLSVFSDGNGFAIVSRDDRFPALLAYGTGCFNKDDMPENVKWWMEAMQRAMAAHIRNGSSFARTDSYTAISPIMTTKWGQGTPYNNYAPAIKSNNGQKAPAGCVAIALAQIMNFQKYPASAEFTGHYYAEGSDELYTAKVNTTYAWPYNNYYSYYFPEGSTDYVQVTTSPRQGNLVATLCRDCAYAINMQYTSTGSGAYTSDVPEGIIYHFGYPETAVRYYYRDFYTDDEWKDIIYGEIAMGSPFIYSGSDAQGGAGHAFVADGMDADGLLHINWGWSGQFDGYFAFDLLNPDTDEFSAGQEIVTGIRPYTLDTDIYGSMIYAAPYSFSYNNETKVFGFEETGIYNYCGKSIIGDVGIVCENLTVPDSTIYLGFMETGDTLMNFYGWRAYADSVEIEFYPGQYRLYFASMDYRETEWQMARGFGGTFYYEMTVDENGMVTMGSEPVSPTGIERTIFNQGVANQPNRRIYNGIYNLKGQRVGEDLNGLRKGIYIQDGKTFIKGE